MIPRPARTHPLLAGLLAAMLSSTALADVTQVSPNGFTSSFREAIRATPEEAWKAIVQLPRWWSDAHTYSGKASNLTLDARAGGCWCESWNDGASSVQHATVVLVMPNRLLRARGGLGPLQDQPVEGVLNIVTSAQDGRTFLRISYRVGGPPDVGLDKLAPVVDQVMGAQFQRLKTMIETGKPD